MNYTIRRPVVESAFYRHFFCWFCCRYKIEKPSDSVSLTNLTNSEEENNSTDDDAELCHCRTHDNGEMVACDNMDCKIKWYHFECVGLYKTPEGLWYCPTCIIFENVTTWTRAIAKQCLLHVSKSTEFHKFWAKYSSVGALKININDIYRQFLTPTSLLTLGRQPVVLENLTSLKI